MAKTDAGDWKTPLGYYERAIAEFTKTREQLHAELHTLQELQASQATLKGEFQATQTEIQNLKAEFQAAQKEIQNLKEELQIKDKHLAIAQQTVNEAQAMAVSAQNAAHQAQTELQSLQAELQATKEYLTTAQQTAAQACTEIESLQSGIKNGTIVAQKALMLRGRDDNHWMKFNFVDKGIDVFELWTSHDNQWHNAIKIGRSDLIVGVGNISVRY